MLLEELAEDLVSATSGLLDGRIINIDVYKRQA